MAASRRETLLLAALLLGCFVTLFAPGLLRSEVPAFRDAYHFYYPQAVWLDQQAERGELFPGWNPQSGLGTSVPAQASSGLYYPLRVLWLVPGLSVAQRLSLVIVTHLVIAAMGMSWAAARLGLSNRARWLSAFSFSLSCPVFFQHTNLIYLCSAAWVGFALVALIDWHRHPDTPWHRSCLLFATSLSLMILAGDFHTCVNSLVLATALAAGWTLGQAWKSAHGSTAVRFPWGTATARVLWLAVALLLIAGATWVQWLPTLRYSRLSGRLAAKSKVTATATHNDVAPASPLAQLQRYIPSNTPSTHHNYDFSLPPWYILTTIWPTLGGHYLPENSRWVGVIPAEGRMWVPGIYFGLIPCCLAVGALRRAHANTRWLVAITAFAFLASLGNYSMVWLVRQLLAGGDGQLATLLPPDSFSSLYWVLTCIVPGYAGFRYPAKWTVWFIAGGSLLAGMGLDQRPSLAAGGWPLASWTRWLVIAPSACLVGGCGGLLLWSHLQTDALTWLPQLDQDRWFGPTDPTALLWTLCSAGLVPLSVAVLAPRLMKRSEKGIVWLTLFEMAFVASHWIAFVAAPAPDQLRGNLPPSARVWVDATEFDMTTLEPARGKDGDSDAVVFVERQTAYQRQFLLGKLNEAASLTNLAASQSILTADVRQLLRRLRSVDRLQPMQPQLDQLLGQLGVTHRLAKSGADDGQMFSWQPIARPAPLCTLDGGSSTAVTRLAWTWPSTRELRIELEPSAGGLLCVRQFNDGGWHAFADERMLTVPTAPALFLQIELPAGTRLVRLERKPLW